jgi:hypothetical protein
MKTGLAVGCMALFAAVGAARADDKGADIEKLYEISTTGTVDKLKLGEKGVVVISIRSKSGAHVSDEAPLKIELGAKGDTAKLTFAKEKLTLADSVTKKVDGQKYTDPRFEIPVTATGASGKATIEPKLTFFICTETLCARQQKTLSLPVEVL